MLEFNLHRLENCNTDESSMCELQGRSCLFVPEKVCVCVFCVCLYMVFCPKFPTSPMRPEEAFYLSCGPADAHSLLHRDSNV